MVNTVFRAPQQLKKQPATEVTLWVHPFVKAELKRLAELDGLSVSKTGATLLEDALHQKIHLRQAILFEPMIERAIAKQMQGMSNRLAWLLVRIAFDVGQIRGLATNILGRQAGVNEEILKTILQESRRAAKMSMGYDNDSHKNGPFYIILVCSLPLSHLTRQNGRCRLLFRGVFSSRMGKLSHPMGN